MTTLSNITSNINVYKATFEQQTPEKLISSKSSDQRITSDSVSISKEGALLANNSANNVRSSKAVNNNLPVNAFALPKWMTKWLPDNVALTENVDELKSADELSVPGSKDLYAFPNKGIDSKESREYNDTLFKHLQGAMNDLDVPVTEYYEETLTGGDKIDTMLFERMKERLGNDSKMMDLMEHFKIDL